MIPQTKCCRKCLVEKPSAEFNKGKQNVDGLASYCRDCSSAASKDWYRANYEYVTKKNRDFYVNNREEILVGMRIYARNNPDKIAAQGARRRLREQTAPGGPFSPYRPDYQERVATYDGLCAYCQAVEYTEFDHAIPLSRGGTNHMYNVFPVCVPCNRGIGGKHSKILWLEWEPRAEPR